MRILLVQPAPFEPGRIGLENVVWLSEPVALTCLASMIPEHDVRILDMRLEEDVVLNQVLLDFQPDIVGTTSMTTDCYQAKAICQITKGTLGDRCFTIVGGHHPTLCPSEFEDPVVDALCIGEGEETFQELAAHMARGGNSKNLKHVPGLRFRNAQGLYENSPPRSQIRELDTFPAPARHLIPDRYRKEYFFAVASPMGSMMTSRGCSFDCNFCSIWEFYERRTRYLSAKAICDRMEAMPEKFLFFLDDNFLTSRKRLEELCSEIERRGIKKFFGTQGRSDFIADNPELMKRLRNAGLFMVLSGYESNDDNALEALKKGNTFQKNKDAAELMRKLGMISTGIFMVRPDFSDEDFDELFKTINEMGVAVPLVTILTPLPGTQLFREKRDELLTRDARLFDILHAVLPTKLPRERFYQRYTEWHKATMPSYYKGILASICRRPGFFLRALPGILRYSKKAANYRLVAHSPESHLQDEVGVLSASGQAPSFFEESSTQSVSAKATEAVLQ